MLSSKALSDEWILRNMAEPHFNAVPLFCRFLRRRSDGQYDSGYHDKRRGGCQIGTAIAGVWQRFMTRMLEEPKVEKKFTGHDLRAKCAGDAASLEHAGLVVARRRAGRLTGSASA